MLRSIQILISVYIFSFSVYAQEIDFGDFSSAYAISLTDLNPGLDLDYDIIAKNTGVNSLSINESKVLSIEGVKYLDVYVDIVADEYLLKDANPSCSTNPNCRIPFTLQAAYANKGQNSTSQAIEMTVFGFTASAQFPIRYRGNTPPGPPPTPVYSGYNPALFNDTAYLYVYGSINVGNVDAGNYTANINIIVNYD